MPDSSHSGKFLRNLRTADFNIDNLEDEIRVDGLCLDLLRCLYRHLTVLEARSPEEAGCLCRGADFFLREFIIADRNDNLLTLNPIRARQFAGHWYIVRTPEPNMIELQMILTGTIMFYKYLAEQKLISLKIVTAIEKHCLDFAYYSKRIEDFWAIEGDGYHAWRQECPLEPSSSQGDRE